MKTLPIARGGRQAIIKICAHCNKRCPTQNKYCSQRCATKARRERFLASAEKRAVLWEAGDETVLPVNAKKGYIRGWAREYLFQKAGVKCERCAWTVDLNDGRLPPLEVHHIDSNYKNNLIGNLIVLCPNCHAVEERLNPVPKGNGRWSQGDDIRAKAKS